MSIVYLGKATPASGQGGGGSITVDQTYDATSTNAQSGTAVAEALGTITSVQSVDNANTAVGAISPLKLWNGTEQEWNNGESITYYRWENEDISATPSQVYTTDRTPTTSSKVYNPKGVLSDLTVTSHSSSGVETITLSNRGTYQYIGKSIQTLSIGEVHPDYLCFINGVGIKIGTTSIVTVDQTYNASSTNAQSGVAVNSVVGNINTALESIIAQGD